MRRRRRQAGRVVHESPRRQGQPREPRSAVRQCTLAYNGILLDPHERLARRLKRVGEARIVRADFMGESLRGDRLRAAADRHLRTDPTPSLNCATTPDDLEDRPTRSRFVFFNRLGATEVEPDTICNNAGQWPPVTAGKLLVGFDPRTVRMLAPSWCGGRIPPPPRRTPSNTGSARPPGEEDRGDPVRSETAAGGGP